MSRWLSYEEVHGREHTVKGEVLVWRGIEGAPGIPPRDVLAYLPPSLAQTWGRGSQPSRRYPTLYFHDGQNVFDERTSHSGEWRADEALEALAAEGLEAIAVALPNSGEGRMDEYNPWPGSEPFWRDGKSVGGKGDAYLAWLVGVVKPLVDRSFPTSLERLQTGVVGSSMGGLISLYALLTHGDTFGLAGVLSPSLRWSDYRVLRLIEERGLAPSRIHLDMGGREWRGMLAEARRLRDLLVANGFEQGRDLHYVEERYAPHRETAWASRLPDALRFLLSAGSPGAAAGD